MEAVIIAIIGITAGVAALVIIAGWALLAMSGQPWEPVSDE